MIYQIIGASTLQELQQEVVTFLNKNDNFILQGGIYGDNNGYYQVVIDVKYSNSRTTKQLLTEWNKHKQ